jgi:aminoglycoside phosphotransferase (APT) family kinase protein
MANDMGMDGPSFELKEQTRSLETVRAGLQDWLRQRLDDPKATIDELAPPSGTGVANETLIFDLRRGSGVTEGYVARLATPDPLYLDEDLSRHYRMYETMMSIPTVPTPDVLGYEGDAGLLGAPFFVMEKIDGMVATDMPSWATEGFIAEATPAQRRSLWEGTVRLLAEMHRLPPGPFEFLRTGATGSGAGDCLDYWIRSMRWAKPEVPVPLAAECEEWLLAHQPAITGFSWGDSRLPNVISRDYTPKALLDWDLVSLAGPQADLAWWMIMEPSEARELDGIGSQREFVDLWEDLTGLRASDLHWYLVFGAYRLAAIFVKMFSMMVAKGHLKAEDAQAGLTYGLHVQLMAGLLELTPPPGVTPVLPDILSR